MRKLLLAIFLFIPLIGYCTTSPNSVYTISSPLTIQIDYKGGSNAIYVGRAASGAITTDSMWQIEYITYDASGDALTVQWSPHYSTFGDKWSSHDVLSYS